MEETELDQLLEMAVAACSAHRRPFTTPAREKAMEDFVRRELLALYGLTFSGPEQFRFLSTSFSQNAALLQSIAQAFEEEAGKWQSR